MINNPISFFMKMNLVLWHLRIYSLRHRLDKMKLMGNKLTSKLRFKIILGVIFLGVIIIPDVINYLRFGTETKERIEFILNNPYKISGTASYTNYDGKNKEGVVNNTFFLKC